MINSKGKITNKILHISPHLGGGVGNIISKITAVKGMVYVHIVVLLEEPIDCHYVNMVHENGIRIVLKPDFAEMKRLIYDCDILLIHWWHHPKISEFLYKLPSIPVRLVLWSHISNITAPSMHPAFISKASRVFFTTEASYEAYGKIDNDMLYLKTAVVPGCGGIDPEIEPKHRTHDGFNIGYLGYIDFSKLHKEFISFCKAVNIPKARFIMAGNAPIQGILERQARDANMINPLMFFGYITDINNMFAELDVFGYPLMPMHTCTTENSILEAMAAEVPPVLLNQLTERYIVRDGITGLLVSNAEEYGRAIRYLHENPSQRQKIGKNAREAVLSKYSFTKVLDMFYENVELVMSESKQYISFADVMGHSPAEWFMSCLGTQRDLFFSSYVNSLQEGYGEAETKILECSPLLKMEKKSSVLHYADVFHNDPILQKWAGIVRSGGNEY